MSSDDINAQTVVFVQCQYCYYKSKWKHNVTRHMMVKHPSTNVSHASTNVSHASSEIYTSKQCIKCNYIFSKRYTMLKHFEKCKGNKLECEFCKNIYSSRVTKSKHMRICRVKKEAESIALLIKSEEAQPTNQNVTYNQNVQIINNNITNNNIIVFRENEPLLSDHITKNYLKKLLGTNDYSELLSNFSEAILKRKENQCVRKTNLRSSSSSVHIGNDIWEARPDHQAIPRLLSNLAITFAGSMECYKIAVQKALDQFIEDVTCNGEHGTDDSSEIAQMQRMYKNTVSNLKHILFNLTKQTLGERKANAVCQIQT